MIKVFITAQYFQNNLKYFWNICLENMSFKTFTNALTENIYNMSLILASFKYKWILGEGVDLCITSASILKGSCTGFIWHTTHLPVSPPFSLNFPGYISKTNTLACSKFFNSKSFIYSVEKV